MATFGLAHGMQNNGNNNIVFPIPVRPQVQQQPHNFIRVIMPHRVPGQGYNRLRFTTNTQQQFVGTRGITKHSKNKKHA